MYLVLIRESGTNYQMKLRNLYLLLKFSMAMSVLSTTSYAQYDHEEITCLADNIYWEARNQTTRGMIAVANVTRNRVKSPHYPDTYCGVIKEGPMRESWKTRQNADLPNSERVFFPKRYRCQFSWYCDGKSDVIPNQDQNIYELATAISFKIIHGDFSDNTNGSTHYHADYVTPDWATQMEKIVVIGNHIFYKFP